LAALAAYAFVLRGVIPVRIVPVEPTVSFTPAEIFRFENAASLALWEQKVFKGDTVFEVRADEDGRRYLRSTSENSCSGLYMKTHHPAAPGLHLRWAWRVHEFPKKREPMRLANRAADDFAARLYVIFLAPNLFRSDVIEYVWDEKIPVGTVEDSPYSDRIKLFVIRSGPSGPENGGWQEEQRNPLQDYMKLFGKAPRHAIGILALMSDSDNTGTRAEADFGDILLGTQQ
jgi:hypothetical protein